MKTLDDIRNKNGHIVIEMSRDKVVTIFHGLGICDWCNTPKPHGYLIPVLSGQWYCDDCKKDWEAKAKFYPEDKDYEDKKALQILKIIALGKH
jgi:hypothetical protein